MIKIGIVGATGLVGRKMLEVLSERDLPEHSIRLFASERSQGKEIQYKRQIIKVEVLNENSFDDLDYALFSAGGDTSRKYAEIAASKDCIVIDNSSAWRRDEKHPLVVPEVNSDTLNKHNKIIANPNCSTIQLVVALKPIQDSFGLTRLICSTYQSISGAGQFGLDKLNNEIESGKLSPENIAYNTLFHPFEDGNTVEENKMHYETKRILNNQNLKTAFTCVRLPILGGHAESLTIETEKEASLEAIINTLKSADGLVVPENYPTPLSVMNRDEVFVGRIRKDEQNPRTFHLWVVADNLRKGAATNAVQILQAMY